MIADDFKEFCVQALISTTAPQCRGRLRLNDRRCALGVIAEAAGLALDATLESPIIEWCRTLVAMNFLREQIPTKLLNAITEWNDYEGLTFDQIAQRIKDYPV